MLRTIIISPDAELAGRLEKTIESLTGEITVCRIVKGYPASVDLLRTLRAHAPEVVFLSFEDLSRAVETVKFLETEARGLQVIAIHRTCDASLLRESMRAGVREFLAYPFESSFVLDALRNVTALLERRPPEYSSTDTILAFLPSKAGVGTTTLALNISAALARRPNCRVLLNDLDLNSGMLRFLLKLKNERSVIDAVELAGEMDESLWPQLVTSIGNLDVLHAGHVNPNVRIEAQHIRNLLQFMQRNYQAVCFDLSGNLERYSLEIMQEAKRVVLVCTPEIPSLHLAREKLAFLGSLGLHQKVIVALNRAEKRTLFSKSQVEELLGVPVARTFSNDYFAVSRATTEGECLDPESVIGKQCTEFANYLTERPASSPERKRKFLQYFNVPEDAMAARED